MINFTAAWIKSYVQKYVTLKALQIEVKEMQDEIKTCLQQKKYREASSDVEAYSVCPKDSMFQLRVRVTERASYPWQDECIKMYKLHFGKDWQKKLDAFKATCDPTPVVTLEEPKATQQASEKMLEKLLA